MVNNNPYGETNMKCEYKNPFYFMFLRYQRQNVHLITSDHGKASVSTEKNLREISEVVDGWQS